MSTFGKVDPSTLGWVKGEIDETLKQARLALESFAENPSDKTQLRFCITHLHQVVGTLTMVELDGAAMLARETEQLAEALLSDKAESLPVVLETLVRAMVTLPDYLARLQFGQTDAPFKYVPLLNEMRAARGGATISELELFTPDFSVRPPPALRAKTPLEEPDYRTLARSLRTTMQASLLTWLRNANPDGLAQIATVFDQLRDQASFGPHEQLFWIAGGFVEALVDGLEPTAERKKLFARVDQQIKRIGEGAEKAELRKNAETVMCAMLWEIGNSPTHGASVTQLRQAFGLESLLADSPTTQMYEMPAPEVLNSVANALGAEVMAAQDLLTTYFDPANHDPQVLEQLLGQLHKMASALDMLGVTPLKQLVDEITAVCQALIENRIDNPEATAMPLAEALLGLESGAREVTNSPTAWSQSIEDGIQRLRALHTASGASGIEVGEAELTETEFKQLLGVVASEVRSNLAKIEEAVESFAADTARVEVMRDVPGLLAQIQGAMQILAQDQAAALAELTRGHVESIVAHALAPTPAVMDALAVCVGTIGAYMEGLHADRRNLDALLGGAQRDMEAAIAAGGTIMPPKPSHDLNTELETWLAAPHDDSLSSSLRAVLDGLVRSARARGEERLARIAGETDRLVQIVSDDASRLTPEVMQALRQSIAALATTSMEARAEEESAPTPVLAPAPSPVRAKPAEPVDDEIREIFIEDARDVLSTIGRHYAIWRDNTDSKEAFAELRRGFHTLKGSGRMVNASEIAEFSWALENLLNRVRDGKINCTQDIVDVVGEAQKVLPQMVSHYAGGEPPTIDAEPIARKAQALSQSSAAAAAPTPVRAPAVETGLPQLDGTLLDIFTNEARGHLDSIEREISISRAEGARLVSEVLFRSTHTLAGNARSLGIDMMSEACHETERTLQGLRSQSLPVDEPILDVLGRLHAAVTDLVNALHRREHSSGQLQERFTAIARVARALMPHSDSSFSVEQRRPSPFVTPDPPGPVPTPRVRPTPAVKKAGAPIPMPEVDPELLEIFHEEAGEILTTIDESLARLRANAGDHPALADFKRALHTLKGGGRMAGVFVIGDLAHVTESLLKRIEDGYTPFNDDVFDLFHEVHDVLLAMLDTLEQGQGVAVPTELYAKMVELAPELPVPEAVTVAAIGAVPVDNHEDRHVEHVDVASRTVAPPSFPDMSVSETTPLVEVADERREGGDDDTRVWPEKADRRGQIKVRTTLLNDLVNFAGEVSISRSRMEQQIHSFRDNLGELSRNVVRFRDQIRELEIQSESQILYRLEHQGAEVSTDLDFDPLEFDRFSRLQQLSRGLAESLHDLSTIQNNLGTFVGEAETVLQQQARLNTELQEGLMRTRMVSFDTIAARLRHIVRVTAREIDKSAELDLSGAEVELDRTVLERMIGPFEHMIRNSLDHGIESPEERRRAGKPATGKISIACIQEGSEIVIRFSDDGAGLNIEAIRNKAIERGLLSVGASLTDEEIIQFILVAGFSTASKITHLSGRGVGMDVVHNEVKQLGGTMSVDTQRGAGAAFIVRLPLTLSITQALMVYVGDQVFAVPLGSVANIVEFSVDKLRDIAVGKNPMLEWQEQVYPYMHLGQRLGVENQPRNARKVPVLLVRTGTREIAMQVDGLGGTREVVIKALGQQLVEIKGLAGATILGDGRVVLILDLGGLWYREDTMHLEAQRLAPAPADEKPKPEVRERPLIMVVDDSLTVRKVTGKHIQKRGMEVITAKDGVDAVEQLRDRVPDVMLIDIEMPRMDGYELTQRVRGDERLQHVPIIMITSRAGAKHRQKAMELGVDLYMSKPYQEEELFNNIDSLLASGRTAG